MRIEVDLYSGRPNPAWSLSSDDEADLKRRVDALPVLPTTSLVDGGLGFRGFVIHFDDLAGHQATVASGVVTVERADGDHVQRSDPGRRLEQWLIASGTPHLPSEILDLARRDLPPPAASNSDA